MITWVCDSCHTEVEHSDANAPEGWATVKTVITHQAGEVGEVWENDHAAALCPGCRAGSGAAMEVRIQKILRAGLDQSPRAAR